MEELIDPFARLLDDCCPPAAVRAVEGGGDPGAIWGAVAESGFLDVLVPESAGGAGIGLPDAIPLMRLIGAHAMPIPIAETMVARAILAAADVAVPDGPIRFAVDTLPVPAGYDGAYILVGTPEAPGSMDARTWSGTQSAAFRPLAAVTAAALIAGACDRVAEMSVSYANDRTQFGKPVGRQQAIQQQLAVMAEQAIAARIAADIGAGRGLAPTVALAAVAKHGTAIAALSVAEIAHAVHGAIGISEAHDLQLLTRAMRRWRLTAGGEGWWAERLGREAGAADRTAARHVIDATATTAS